MAAWVIAVVGITGGIGSGKTTLTHLFAKQGIPTLDLDRVGQHILTHDSKIKTSLCELFGSNILQADSSINRPALAKVAFQTQASIDALNRIMHPAIKRQEMHWRSQQNTAFAIVEASVLIESGEYQRMNSIVVVFSTLQRRRQRVLQRGKQTAAMFDAIVSRQCNDKQRQAIADYSIENNDDLQSLILEQTILYNQLLRLYLVNDNSNIEKK